MTTKVKWIDAASELPDSDIEVLIVVADQSHKGEVWIGHHDGERWRAASGGMVGVSHWADMPDPPAEAFY